jgi:hypothetical protein
MLRPRQPDYAAQSRASSAETEARSLQQEVYRLRRKLAHTEALGEAAVEESGGNAIGTNGLTLAGYTNNLDREIQLVINHWVLHYAPLADECHRDRYCTYYLTEGQKFARSRLSVGHKKDINLRVLCRMEWFDWCMHNHVMVQAALALPHIKDMKLKLMARTQVRKYLNTYKQAMDYSQSEKVRADFEELRYDYWRGKGNIQFEQDPKDGVWFPSTKATLAANPEARFDLHLPAGKIAEKFGINIETMEPAKRYRDKIAGSILGGLKNQNSSYLYI